MSGKIVMIGSMKGGVSKTVTTFNLAYSLSKLGKKVLAVDFDSQANLSTCLGVENVTAVPVTNWNLVLTLFENNNTTYQIIRTKYDSARSFDVDKLPGILRTHINQYTSNDKTSYAPIPLVLEHNNSRSEHNCNPYPDHRIDCTKTTYKT